MPMPGTSFWRTMFPLNSETFLDRLDAGTDGGAEAVRICVSTRLENGEPAYRVEYEALQGDHVLLRARDVFTTAEFRNHLRGAEGDIPADIESTLDKRVKERIGDVETRIRGKNVAVEVWYT